MRLARGAVSVVVFAVSLPAIAVIAIAGLASVFAPGWRFWPAPDSASVQYRLSW